MKKSLALTVTAAAMAGMILAGCSSKPSEAEMRQLEALRAEVASLEKEVAAREAEKAALLKAIADKNAQLDECAKEKAAVAERLKGK
ncbi:MAG: hypothetical protein FJ215_00280 [Ignavibacteria bacterium]|nr:hypothetical protein [Ignavibacteria bacterium]